MNNAFCLKVALLEVMEEVDDYGNQKFKITKRNEVLSSEVSVSRNEFYEASRSGYKVTRVIRVNNFLYKGERYISIEKKVYKVVRTYLISHLLELTLEDTKLSEVEGWLV